MYLDFYPWIGEELGMNTPQVVQQWAITQLVRAKHCSNDEGFRGIGLGGLEPPTSTMSM